MKLPRALVLSAVCLLGAGRVGAQPGSGTVLVYAPNGAYVEAYPPTLAPPSMGACKLDTPATESQTDTTMFQVYNCNGDNLMNQFTITATGTGYCSGMSNGWCTANGSPAPVFTPTAAVGASGLTFTVWINVNSVSTDDLPFGMGCGQVAITNFFESPPPSIPACCAGPPGPPPQSDCPNGGSWYWNTYNCAWACQNSETSPIILDIDGTGYHLTNVAGGVLFDFFGNGKPIQIAWTAAGSTNAFLALPRNGTGLIDNGADLFGNLTPQPPCAKGRNGWNALAVYDLPQNGENGNGMIDPGDAIYSKPLLWIDSNHDGISQPWELYRLADLGVEAISLDYRLTPWKDQWGNEFRYLGQVYGTQDSSLARKAYDVILLAAPYY